MIRSAALLPVLLRSSNTLPLHHSFSTSPLRFSKALPSLHSIATVRPSHVPPLVSSSFPSSLLVGATPPLLKSVPSFHLGAQQRHYSTHTRSKQEHCFPKAGHARYYSTKTNSFPRLPKQPSPSPRSFGLLSIVANIAITVIVGGVVVFFFGVALVAIVVIIPTVIVGSIAYVLLRVKFNRHRYATLIKDVAALVDRNRNRIERALGGSFTEDTQKLAVWKERGTVPLENFGVPLQINYTHFVAGAMGGGKICAVATEVEESRHKAWNELFTVNTETRAVYLMYSTAEMMSKGVPMDVILLYDGEKDIHENQGQIHAHQHHEVIDVEVVEHEKDQKKL